MKGFLQSRIKVLDNGRELLKMGQSVNFAVVTKDKIFIASLQKRAGLEDKETIGIFGGYVDSTDNSVVDAMYRELKEETNLDSSDVDTVNCVYSNLYLSQGYTDERSSLYVLVLNKTYSEIRDKIKCNDCNEDISFVTIANEMDLRKLFNPEGIKGYLAKKYILEKVYKKTTVDELTKKENITDDVRLAPRKGYSLKSIL